MDAGVDGGFESQELEYEATHKIVVLPTYVELPFPSVELPEKVLPSALFFSLKGHVSAKGAILLYACSIFSRK